MKETIEIDGTKIGARCAPYIIAEMSGNHNHDFERAKRLLKIAKDSGANAIKLQTYTPDTMTISCDKDYFKITEGPWKGNNLYNLYEMAHTPWEWHKELFAYAKELGITIFSTPFDETAVDFLEELDVPAYKIASFEVTDLPLIKYVAEKGKPMIISSGMANLGEIEDALETIKSTGNDQVILLHCVSGYPTPIAESNIQTMVDLKKRFGTIIGLSDHTLSTSVAVASIALGAALVEKHYTDDRNNEGPDSAFSLEPAELKTLVDHCNEAYESIGEIGYSRKESEEKSVVFRRSIFFVKDIKAGEVVTEEHIRRIRPGYGLKPKHFNEVVGKKVTADITRGTPVSWDNLEL